MPRCFTTSGRFSGSRKPCPPFQLIFLTPTYVGKKVCCDGLLRQIQPANMAEMWKINKGNRKSINREKKFNAESLSAQIHGTAFVHCHARAAS